MSIERGQLILASEVSKKISGTYTGVGANEFSLTFDTLPQILFIWSEEAITFNASNSYYPCGCIFYKQNYIHSLFDNGASIETVHWNINQKKITIYWVDNQNDYLENQYSKQGVTYHYFAII